jgi:hypothetical protein
VRTAANCEGQKTRTREIVHDNIIITSGVAVAIIAAVATTTAGAIAQWNSMSPFPEDVS